MTKFDLVMTTWPPLAVTLNFLTLPPKIQAQMAWVSSWPKMYRRIGLGSSRKMMSQQAAPPMVATQIVSALPVAASNLTRAFTAPAQNGSNRTAMMVLIHFGTGVL